MVLDRHRAAAQGRDIAARLAWYLPHNARRSLYRRLAPRTAELHDVLRKSLPGEAGETMGLRAAEELGCIFVHIPKNGGTSVGRSLFGHYRGNHLPIGTYQLIYDRDSFDSRFKFTFTRDPYDRLLSAYWFGRASADGLSASGQGEPPRAELDGKPALRNAVAGSDTFEQFVIETVTPANARLWEHLRPQHRFVCTPDGKLAVDFVGRFENFSNDFAKVCEKLGVGVSLLHERKTPRATDVGAPIDQYTPEMREIVQTVYGRDFELFGYDRGI